MINFSIANFFLIKFYTGKLFKHCSSSNIFVELNNFENYLKKMEKKNN